MKFLFTKLKHKQPEPKPVQEGSHFICPLCGSNQMPMAFPVSLLENLHRHRFKYNIFQTETVHFSQYACSQCLATDRDRLYVLFLRNWLQQQTVNIEALEIGPSGPLRQWLAKQPNVIYRCADLFRKDVDDNVDITNMTAYSDHRFRMIVCSHVLEHVADDRKAMTELYRILHPEGVAIIMVPINLGVTSTDEDPALSDIAERWHRFGQDDHIRMYAKHDFINRLQSAGFHVQLLDQSHFGKQAFEQHGIFPTSVLYIASKRA